LIKCLETEKYEGEKINTFEERVCADLSKVLSGVVEI